MDQATKDAIASLEDSKLRNQNAISDLKEKIAEHRQTIVEIDAQIEKEKQNYKYQLARDVYSLRQSERLTFSQIGERVGVSAEKARALEAIARRRIIIDKKFLQKHTIVNRHTSQAVQSHTNYVLQAEPGRLQLTGHQVEVTHKKKKGAPTIDVKAEPKPKRKTG